MQVEFIRQYNIILKNFKWFMIIKKNSSVKFRFATFHYLIKNSFSKCFNSRACYTNNWCCFLHLSLKYHVFFKIFVFCNFSSEMWSPLFGLSNRVQHVSNYWGNIVKLILRKEAIDLTCIKILCHISFIETNILST